MRKVISFENSIEIHKMEESEAITLLLRVGCLDPVARHLQAVKAIGNELGCIPLTINHAGVHIEAGRCSINSYLRKYWSHCQALNIFTGASNYNQILVWGNRKDDL